VEQEEERERENKPTIHPAALFVCRPWPRIPSATMVGKHTLSKKSVSINMAIPVFRLSVMAALQNAMTEVM
jgi:hypothetical protein